MSRSYKKGLYITFACYVSNKECKKWAHRVFRARTKRGLRNPRYMPYRLREVSDVWDFDSDGLAHWDADMDRKYLRK